MPSPRKTLQVYRAKGKESPRVSKTNSNAPYNGREGDDGEGWEWLWFRGEPQALGELGEHGPLLIADRDHLGER